MAHKLVLLAGDGTGPEVMREAVKVLKAVQDAFRLSFDTIPYPAGGQYYLDTGAEWPDGAFESCRAADAILLGAVGLPDVSLPNGDLAGVGVVFGLRFGLDLYPNVRPTKLYPNVKHKVHDGCKQFRRIFDEVAAGYPGIRRDYAYIDAFQQWLIRSPEAYDVAVTSNVFGDIATDLAAVLQGGMGMAAGANIGDAHAMFEPIHCSAPKHAGKDEVNPIAMILAQQMMLDWLRRRNKDPDLPQAATTVAAAVEHHLIEGKALTYDLGGKARCSEVGSAIAAAIPKIVKRRDQA